MKPEAVAVSEIADFEPHRRALVAHCFRMSGSLADAEDIVQETLLRAWQQRSSFEGRSSLRTWLLRIATNAAIDALRARKRRTLPQKLGAPSRGDVAMAAPALDQEWLEPFPDDMLPDDGEHAAGPEARVSQRESVATAFLVAVHELTAQQRAVLLLRDVLGFTASEAADALALTVVAVNSTLQRARVAVAAAATPERAPDDEATRTLLTRYVQIWETRDLGAFTALLRDDSVLSMPPIPSWYRGADDVVAALAGSVLVAGAEVHMRAVRANGTHAFAGWQRANGGAWAPLGIQLVDVNADGRSVRSITCFVGASWFGRFGLPLTPV